MSLATYLLDCQSRLRANPSLDLFLDLRYRELGRL